MTRTAETIYLVIWFEYANHFDQPLFEYQKVLQTYYISILFELSALNFLSIILRQIISAKLAKKSSTIVDGFFDIHYNSCTLECNIPLISLCG